MSALEIKAIKALPEEYVRDGTVTIQVAPPDQEQVIVAMHPSLAPIWFRESIGWQLMEIESK